MIPNQTFKLSNTSPTKNIVFWSKKDIILRRKKMFSETVFGRKDIIIRRQKILCFGRKKI